MNAESGTALGVPRLVLRWCLWYTRGLDSEVARDRQNELASDLHEQLATAQASGVDGWKTHASILARAIAGAPADLSWRAGRLGAGEIVQAVHRRNRINEAFALVVFLVGITVVGGGIYLYARLVRALDLQVITYVPGATAPIIVLTLIGLIGCGLLLRRSTRGWGSLLLILPSAVLPILAVGLLYTISATAGAFIGYDPARSDGFASVGSAILVFLFAFSAFWWLVIDRRAPVASIAAERIQQ